LGLSCYILWIDDYISLPYQRADALSRQATIAALA